MVCLSRASSSALRKTSSCWQLASLASKSEQEPNQAHDHHPLQQQHFQQFDDHHEGGFRVASPTSLTFDPHHPLHSPDAHHPMENKGMGMGMTLAMAMTKTPQSAGAFADFNSPKCSGSELSHSMTCSRSASSTPRAGQPRSTRPAMAMCKPPRHTSVPMCGQMLLKLWKQALHREDVTLTSDLFDDLHADEQDAEYLVVEMQHMGFNISYTQFVSLPSCSIWSVLMVAL